MIELCQIFVSQEVHQVHLQRVMEWLIDRTDVKCIPFPHTDNLHGLDPFLMSSKEAFPSEPNLYKPPFYYAPSSHISSRSYQTCSIYLQPLQANFDIFLDKTMYYVTCKYVESAV